MSESWKRGARLTRVGPEPALWASLSCAQEGTGLWLTMLHQALRSQEAKRTKASCSYWISVFSSSDVL